MLFRAFQLQTTGQINKVSSSERSASQIYRGTPHLMARSRRTPRILLAYAVRSFSTTEAHIRQIHLHSWQSLRPMAASACSPFEGYEDIREAIAREKQLKGWRRERKLDLIRTINPEFKDLAQTWGRKMITVHEKMASVIEKLRTA